jgi:hypothetical protein
MRKDTSTILYDIRGTGRPKVSHASLSFVSGDG